MKKISLVIIVVLTTITAAVAQIKTPVKWEVGSKKINNTEAVIFVKATIQNGWHIYGQNVPNGGPISTTFTFKPSKDFTLNGGTIPNVKAKSKYEDVFKMNVPYFTQQVVFQQKIKLNSTKATTLSGVVEFMACDKTECLPPDEYNFSVTIK